MERVGTLPASLEGEIDPEAAGLGWRESVVAGWKAGVWGPCSFNIPAVGAWPEGPARSAKGREELLQEALRYRRDRQEGLQTQSGVWSQQDTARGSAHFSHAGRQS